MAWTHHICNTLPKPKNLRASNLLKFLTYVCKTIVHVRKKEHAGHHFTALCTCLRACATSNHATFMSIMSINLTLSRWFLYSVSQEVQLIDLHRYSAVRLKSLSELQPECLSQASYPRDDQALQGLGYLFVVTLSLHLFRRLWSMKALPFVE